MVMIRSLEQAISKIRNLPEDKQRLAAELLEEIASEGSYALTSDEKNAIREGLGEADSGQFISDTEIQSLLHRPWGK